MGKILASLALCLVCLAGWQYSEAQAKNPVLCEVSGLETKYPKLWERNTIIGFGAKRCRWCAAQKTHLRALSSRGFRVVYFDIKNHKALFKFLGGDGVPSVVIFVDGKAKKNFNGLTHWRHILRHAKDCRKE